MSVDLNRRAYCHCSKETSIGLQSKVYLPCSKERRINCFKDHVAIFRTEWHLPSGHDLEVNKSMTGSSIWSTLFNQSFLKILTLNIQTHHRIITHVVPEHSHTMAGSRIKAQCKGCGCFVTQTRIGNETLSFLKKQRKIASRKIASRTNLWKKAQNYWPRSKLCFYTTTQCQS